MRQAADSITHPPLMPDVGRVSHQSSDPPQRLLERLDRSVDVLEFIQAEQADAEGREVFRLVAFKGNPGGDLHARVDKFLSGADAGVVCVEDDARRGPNGPPERPGGVFDSVSSDWNNRLVRLAAAFAVCSGLAGG